MKILIKRDGKPIRVYHDSRKIRWNKQTNQIFVGSITMPTGLPKPDAVYQVVKEPTLEWFSYENDELMEIKAEFDVK